MEKIFSRWRPQRPFWFNDIETILAIFYLQVSLFRLSYKSVGLSVQEKKRKIDFQDDDHGGHLGIPIETTLAI